MNCHLNVQQTPYQPPEKNIRPADNFLKSRLKRLRVSSFVYSAIAILLAISLVGQNWVYYAGQFDIEGIEGSEMFWNTILAVSLLAFIVIVPALLVALSKFFHEVVNLISSHKISNSSKVPSNFSAFWFVPFVNMFTSLLFLIRLIASANVQIVRRFYLSLSVIYALQYFALIITIFGFTYDLGSWIGSRWATMWWAIAAVCQTISIARVPALANKFYAQVGESGPAV